MSETLIFQITPPTAQESVPYFIDWYQSLDGLIWPNTPVDSHILSTLAYDIPTSMYTWTSTLADPLKYHKLKSRAIDGTESSAGYVIPPRPPIDPDIYVEPSIDAYRITESAEGYEYELGSYVELTLEVDPAALSFIGSTMPVKVLDPYFNVMATLTANRLGTTPLYSVLYRVPVSLSKKYNIMREAEADTSIFQLFDKWIFPDTSFVEFGFRVKRTITSPVKDNSEIYVSVLDGISAEDGTTIDPTTIAFTTKLYPFYCTVKDITDLSAENFSNCDVFSIARTIFGTSKYVDVHMKPDSKYVYYRDRFDCAVADFTKYYTAYEMLGSLTSVTNEDKSLDTFRISKTTDAKALMSFLSDVIDKISKMIYAGGKDTPYAAHTFIKGIHDPNRPNLARANLDTNDPWPFVNASSKSFVYQDANGNTVEARGQRTIVYRYPSRIALDNLDASDNIWGKIK
jgi:hypothetical protein